MKPIDLGSILGVLVLLLLKLMFGGCSACAATSASGSENPQTTCTASLRRMLSSQPMLPSFLTKKEKKIKQEHNIEDIYDVVV